MTCGQSNFKMTRRGEELAASIFATYAPEAAPTKVCRGTPMIALTYP